MIASNIFSVGQHHFICHKEISLSIRCYVMFVLKYQIVEPNKEKKWFKCCQIKLFYGRFIVKSC